MTNTSDLETVNCKQTLKVDVGDISVFLQAENRFCSSNIPDNEGKFLYDLFAKHENIFLTNAANRKIQP